MTLPSNPNESELLDGGATTHFSCDLLANSFKHMFFLRTLHELGVSLKRQKNESLRRYTQLWLPLVNDYPEKELIPPPDIAWLWHCHRLAPREYERYVKERFGVVLEANPPFAVQANDKDDTRMTPFSPTQHIWHETYPTEPFFHSCDDDTVDVTRDDESSLLLSRFDLLSSTEWQGTFLWQVSGERFDDIDFLNEAVENYYKFLRLKPKAQAKRMILVPTYQIDLMWHTHILSSITLYNKDCKAIMGLTLHHDDSLNDRTEGGILDTSYQGTKQIWLEEYGVDYHVEGGMYRGEPPPAYFSKTPAYHQLTAAVVEMGASSTSPNDGPIQWAPLTGLASDGQPAFIPTNTRHQRDLVALPMRENYVLGKSNNDVGYFHLETEEAQTILCDRLEGRIGKLESDLAMSRCCCGSPSSIAIKERKLREAHDLAKVMKARQYAIRPAGVVGARSNSIDMQNFYSDDGVWLYPALLWNSCGGACGGGVVSNAGESYHKTIDAS
jgi:hypothetical protein